MISKIIMWFIPILNLQNIVNMAHSIQDRIKYHHQIENVTKYQDNSNLIISN